MSGTITMGQLVDMKHLDYGNTGYVALPSFGGFGSPIRSNVDGPDKDILPIV